MIKGIYNLPSTKEWCDHCKKECKSPLNPYLIVSTNKDVKDMVLCTACLDMALNEQGILPDEF